MTTRRHAVLKPDVRSPVHAADSIREAEGARDDGLGGAGGGAVAGPMVAYLLVWSSNNLNVPIYVAAVVYVFAALCWLGIDSVTPLQSDGKNQPSAA